MLRMTYDVEKTGYGEGPMKTTTCAEYLKRWSEPDPANISSSEMDDESGGPNCGKDIDGGSRRRLKVARREEEEAYYMSRVI